MGGTTEGGTAVADVFRAIADAHRRDLIRKLAAGSELPLHALMQGMNIGRTAVSKHLAVLKQAGIVSERRQGRETLYRLNAAPLKQVYDWVSFYESFWRAQVLSLQNFLRKERCDMKSLQMEFHLDAPVEAVWRALTESELLTQWMFFKENTFRPIVGHQFYFKMQGTDGWDGVVEGEVLAAEAPRRLVYTWESLGEKNEIEWKLEETPEGTTRLLLEQRNIQAEQAYQGARMGWEAMVRGLEGVAKALS
nr:metalloregulator ArsR/SmtB family transcription factor [Alicyclobacillus mali (ex Roth et al. 2021)]